MLAATLVGGLWLAVWGEAARPPERHASLWATLPPATTAAPADARVVQLRARALGAAYFPAATFTMGSTPSEMLDALRLCAREILRERCEQFAPLFRAEGAAHSVTLAPYSLDRTEVTVGSYRRCVAAGACAPDTIPAGDARFDRDELPVTHVRWEDGRAYCRWRRGRLPTEAEWEHAARGGGRRTFPWGNVYSPRLANHGALAHDMTDASDGHAYLSEVGAFPEGRTDQGVLDLAGNAAEWVSDLYDLDERGFGYAPDAVTNPTGPQSSPLHVIRGGSFTDGAPWMRAAARVATTMPRAAHIGFRCAYEGRAP